MKDHYCFPLMVSFILLLSLTVGCSHTQADKTPESLETTCIQGTVRYRTPDDSTPVRYPFATITAFRHGTDEGLVETKADGAGNYCIEVPLGNYTVDLKVWGVQRLERKSYTCKGSELNIDPGTAPRKCGRDCVKVDILTECGEFRPPYRRQM
jgi:hypothetical protein